MRSALFPVSGPGGPRPGQLLAVSPQQTKPVPLPAPNKGINAVDGLAQMAPDEAIVMINMVPSSYGTRVRTGYREFATSIGTSGGIRTVLPFTGSVVANNRLFATADDGIYNISAGGAIGAADITFPVVNTTSGYGQWTNYTTTAGHFDLYCDETNGYYVYTEAGAWAKVAMGGGANQVSNVDPALFVSVIIFKNRAWFVERNSSRSWYLAAGSIFGAATVFDWGNKFKHGGTLVNLAVWTVDGGEGVDDYLVAISSSGDVIVFKGSDPATATDWFQHGQWFIGAPPAGRRIAGSFGGDVYILSIYGLLPLSRLISGALIQQDDVYLTKKIAPLVQDQMNFSQASLGWEIKSIPSEQLLLLSAPKRIGFDYLQFVQSTNTTGWSEYEDVPYFTGDTWLTKFYIGHGEEQIVYTYEGDLDNVDLSDTNGIQIEWTLIMTFQEFGEPGRYHIGQFIRPVFLAEAPPSFVVEMRYDYDLGPMSGAPSAALPAGAFWDSAIWDMSLWGGDFAVIDTLRGGSGIGRAMAVAMNGQSGSRTVLIRFDLMFNSGGML